MPEAGPDRVTPLHLVGRSAADEAAGGAAGVWAYEAQPQSFITLRGRTHDAPFVAAASAALGTALPVEPCTLADAHGLRVLWLSPDEWLLITGTDRGGAVRDALRSQLSAIHSQVVDNTGGYAEIMTGGREAARALSHATVYNVAQLAVGRVVGTTFGKSTVVLHRTGDGLSLVMRRSFADYAWRTLVRAAQPYGFAHVTPDRASHIDPGPGL